jgi:hypothetical protein
LLNVRRRDYDVAADGAQASFNEFFDILKRTSSLVGYIAFAEALHKGRESGVNDPGTQHICLSMQQPTQL